MTAGPIDPAALDRRLAGAAIAIVLLAPHTLVDGRRTICPIRRATGLPCPTCGLTRSVRAAGRLRLRESVTHHPLGIPALGAAALVASGRWRPSAVTGRPSPVVAAGVAVWVATWIVRLGRAARARPGRALESQPAAR
jgi:hypothetical protein